MVCCRCKQLSLAIAGIVISCAVLLQGLEDAAPRRLEPVPVQAPKVAAYSRRPRYARVGANIETLWQPPSTGSTKGVVFLAHGCSHQATDFFTEVGSDGWAFEACRSSNFGRCLGLPEERHLVQEARGRGYLVVAVSGSSKNRCWNRREDPARVRQALQHVFEQEQLNEELPVLAIGASSGGTIMSSLALALKHPPKCVVPQISMLAPTQGSLASFAALRVPTLFVHMSVHDRRTAMFVERQVAELEASGVRTKELHVSPVPVRDVLLTAFGAAKAEAVEALFQEAGLLTQKGLLHEDPRRSAWREAPGLRARMHADGDTLAADESALSELLNVAWAQHELTATSAAAMLDFCEAAA